MKQDSCLEIHVKFKDGLLDWLPTENEFGAQNTSSRVKVSRSDNKLQQV
jgi:hypothetical protein